MEEKTPILEMRDIVKVYPDGTKALHGVTVQVYEGEILGLLGENGAGKTTLMKILFGMLKPTNGKIFLRGKEVRFKSPADAIANGIGMVHQHFTLVDVFTALENIILGMEGHGLFSKIDLEKARGEIKALMDELNFQVPLDVPVENLPVGVQQRVEILKMLYRNVDILILDEPTAVLTPIEVKELFAVLRKLKAQGKTIIFISHKLNEVMEITDRVTVIRKGKVIGTVKTSEATPQLLARMMVGRDVVLRIQKPPKEPGNTVLKVENLWVKGDRGEEAVRGVSFEVRAGEIFGIAGVEGNGQSELIEAISGLRRVEKGRIYLNGVDITGKSPRDLYDMGFAHIPEDRTHMGLVIEMSVMENSILGMHWRKEFSRGFGLIDWGRVKKHASELIEEFEISAPGVNAPAKSLSGGNQQKLIVAREVSKKPEFIIAAQPTRGVDVASTEYIRNYLVKLRNENKAVLLVSADLDEVLQLSDRMAIMYEGQFMGVVKPEEVTEEQIGLMMGGVKA
ncbi:ABC-type transport system, ATPase component [Thermococcus kodakarensis KOD1]|uniref:ABC-type transport system, ATPase component n=1 Tax=Thermococcus kodakarensis (strain ATCC BAA-918 / JCM 12380 / KOD1) TaxID=69014 RepID=Q5JF69_THEKO|nr:ABC transporter ATP-binding protein [Thermococcus kodakarensis]WCN28695.1 ABC transporter ATP-binding protein [Thermococcus kodakarensis]WCN30993.1 ABC transporter ATP-binding protein [Thermococcus kodakarensis]BAD84847.1 ABC-type transport system, ATPase component [Thermococcus kodakarensis KOD1]